MVKYCNQCGKKVMDTDKFCWKCGNDMIEVLELEKYETNKYNTPITIIRILIVSISIAILVFLSMLYFIPQI